MQIYCVKCKSKTDTDDAHKVKTANGHWRVHGKCNRCSCKKSTFVGQTGGGLGYVINKLIEKGPELHVPSYAYLGPGTKYKEKAAKGVKGIDAIDEAAKSHDAVYDVNGPGRKRLEADKKMYETAVQIQKDPRNSVKTRLVSRFIAKPAMKIMMKVNERAAKQRGEGGRVYRGPRREISQIGGKVLPMPKELLKKQSGGAQRGPNTGSNNVLAELLDKGMFPI